MTTLLLTGIRLQHEQADTRHDLLVENGVITHIETAGVVNPQALPGISDSDEQQLASTTGEPDIITIQTNGLLVLPGFTDLYGRLREPGFSRKGTLASETAAALAGGFTTVLCAPDTQPAIDTPATVELIRQRAADAPGARVIPMAALTVGLDGKQLSELATLKAVGCLAAGQADRPIDNANVLYSAMQYAASVDLPLIMTAHDSQLAANGCAHAGAMATRLGLPGIPVAAESVALARLIELCRETGCRLHISRVSSARAVGMIERAKQDGLLVTADVGIGHLYFTDAQLAGFDSRYHSAVPFRSANDRQALRDGIRRGIIDAICSDHAPHDADASLAPFPDTESGLAVYDHFLPLWLALKPLLELSDEQHLNVVTRHPNAILCDELAPGAILKVGQRADIILIDPDAELTDLSVAATDGTTQGAACAGHGVSAGCNTPLIGIRNLNQCTDEAIPLTGRVHMAIVGGELRRSDY
ncbi:MAG: dihydroorotase [Granulosicoccus sp.]